MKITALFFGLFLFYFFTCPVSVARAQSFCDPCGKCGTAPAPSDYDQCIACLYDNPGPPPSSPKENVQWTVLGCIPTSPGGFTQRLLQIIGSTIGGVMFIVFLLGGFKVLTSAGDMDRLASGKKMVTSSIIALIIILFAVFILRFIAVDLLKIPGFQ